MLPAAVLCGGKGTRIAHLAGDLPKALVPVAGAPFLHHQLRWMRHCGIVEAVLLIGYRGDLIREFAKDGSAFGLRIAYSDDGGEPLGTGGAVLHALDRLGDAFLTLYGDALLSIDLHAVATALHPRDEGVMSVFRNEDRWERSNARVTGDRVSAYDKQAPPGTMTHVDAGVNVFRREAFAPFRSKRSFDLAEVHAGMIARSTLRAFPVLERSHEIGSPEGLAETEAFLLGTAGADRSP